MRKQEGLIRAIPDVDSIKGRRNDRYQTVSTSPDGDLITERRHYTLITAMTTAIW